jgi:GNAT superfamily N-acetyltransferase
MPTALRYWRQVFENLDHEQVLWLAEEDGNIVGTAQLGLCRKENGRHRAEVQKLLVMHTHRGMGIAALVLDALEEYARANKRSLLYLDTIAGSDAEAVYAHLGWSKSGEIPDYAAMPDGERRATAVYYKQIR